MKWRAEPDSNLLIKIFKKLLKDRDQTKLFISLTVSSHHTEIRVKSLNRAWRPGYPSLRVSLSLLFLTSWTERKDNARLGFVK